MSAQRALNKSAFVTSQPLLSTSSTSDEDFRRQWNGFAAAQELPVSGIETERPEIVQWNTHNPI
jgi:hypothetical protein